MSNLNSHALHVCSAFNTIAGRNGTRDIFPCSVLASCALKQRPTANPNSFSGQMPHIQFVLCICMHISEHPLEVPEPLCQSLPPNRAASTSRLIATRCARTQV
eukprot:3230599-Amphidinium_carterae.1